MIHTDITEAREAVESYERSVTELSRLASDARVKWAMSVNRRDRTSPNHSHFALAEMDVRDNNGRLDHLIDELTQAEWNLFERTQQVDRLEAAEVA